jgi:FkbM family methyltransferase
VKQLLRSLLTRLGIDVRAAPPEPDTMDFLRSRQVDTVLDVGANVGQFGESLRSRGYHGRIISFEPVHSVFQSVNRRAVRDGNWEAHNYALGAASGASTINVAKLSVFSSILRTRKEAVEFHEGAVTLHEESIQMRTLDEVAFELSGTLFLKIDTQGYEKQVLLGGHRTLPRLKGVLMELPLIHLYQGTWQFHEAIKFMAAAGFVLAQIHPVNYHTKDSVSLLEVDCLFRKQSQDGRESPAADSRDAGAVGES